MQTTAAANANKPTVAWISHFVFAPDEYYQISFAPYKVQFTQVHSIFRTSSGEGPWWHC